MTGALVVFAVTGMLLYANALQRGDVGPVTAVLWIAEVIVPSAMALLMLGDTVRPGWDLPATVAGLVTVAAAVLLASAPANNDTAVPSADGTAPPPLRPPAPIPVPPRLSRERIIWWGAPPIWVPPSRPQPSVTARPATASLTSAPGHAEPHWRPPRPADADSVTAPRAAQPRWITEEDQPDSRAVPRPRWMSQLDDADVEALLSPGWTTESGFAEPDDAGVANASPPEWPPRRPATFTAPVEQRPAPRSPWHDL